MASSQAILDDVKLRYRHSFTNLQVLVWLNEEQRELFDILELDGPPYTFQTVAKVNFYPIPADLDIDKIKVVTMQIDASDNFTEVEFRRNDDNIGADYGIWYTIVSDTLYLNYSGDMPEDRTVYIYLDNVPTTVTTANLGEEPSTPIRYQEILKLGALKRIAGARKDVVFQNNYSAEHEQKIADVLWSRRLAEPEWVSPADAMPRTGISRYYNKRTAVVITQTE